MSEKDDSDLSDDDLSLFHLLDIGSFRNLKYESEAMKGLLKLEEDLQNPHHGSIEEYNVENMFPSWIVNDPEWKLTQSRHKENEISIIMRIPVQQRTQEQISTLVHWLMSVWETARLMGFKRCAAMSKVFQVLTYEPGENIITEGERGLTFFIIISGTCTIHKIGIGNVASVSRGQSFGELALTEGKNLRTATVKTDDRVEVLRLHKVDYDYFVKDIQLAERRENLHILQHCKGFENWSKAKIRKMVTICKRKTFEPGTFIFRQGDQPDMLYIIIDGQVTISKEIHYSIRNRWPISTDQWECVTRHQVKPYTLAVISKGTCFGEQSIVLNRPRHATAQAKSLCTLLCVDRLEFLHLLEHNSADAFAISLISRSYRDDGKILNEVADLRGGPSTTAQLNDYVITSESGSARPTSSKYKLLHQTLEDNPNRHNPSRRGRKMSLFHIESESPKTPPAPSIASHPFSESPLRLTPITESLPPPEKQKSFKHQVKPSSSPGHSSASNKVTSNMEKFRRQLSITLQSAAEYEQSFKQSNETTEDDSEHIHQDSPSISTQSTRPNYSIAYGMNSIGLVSGEMSKGFGVPKNKKGFLFTHENSPNKPKKQRERLHHTHPISRNDLLEEDSLEDDASIPYSDVTSLSSQASHSHLPSLHISPAKKIGHFGQRKQSLAFDFHSPYSIKHLSPLSDLDSLHEKVAIKERIGESKRKASMSVLFSLLSSHSLQIDTPLQDS